MGRNTGYTWGKPERFPHRPINLRRHPDSTPNRRGNPQSSRILRSSEAGKEGLSSEWIPARGLREGCATSPTLFNIYHADAMRIAQSKRKEKAKEQQ